MNDPAPETKSDFLSGFWRSQYGKQTERLIRAYEEAITLAERRAASGGFGEHLLEIQRGLYSELESVLTLKDSNERHHFHIVIPVADRPLMLKNCLDSIAAQCRIFGYGGVSRNADGLSRYTKITLFIIDDSMDEGNIKEITEMAHRMDSSGIRTHYLGADNQTALLDQVGPEMRKQLSGIFGNYEGGMPPHKGASVTRNIAYLYLHSLLGQSREKVLVYFIDSDEEFRINTSITERPVHFINYFYWLDRIFRGSEVEVFTGKVVGDPPVSPAVMVNTFLDDTVLFLKLLSGLSGDAPCIFHDDLHSQQDCSAEYHDMAGLFGYKGPSAPKRYRCDIRGRHTLADCFKGFSIKAGAFFYGFHPTRVQYYEHRGFMKTEPARTVYTGNYVFTREGFRHFIPFANLRLRMAGPTLGRILKKRLGPKFVSANLPLLHNRTAGAGTAEFRTGVREQSGTVDLSIEYERQFWGDIMLFSIEALTDRGYPDKHLSESQISDTVRAVQEKMLDMYGEKHAAAAGKITRIRRILSEGSQFWNELPELGKFVEKITAFMAGVENNFGADSGAMEKFSADIGKGVRTARLIHAISSLPKDEIAWNKIIDVRLPD